MNSNGSWKTLALVTALILALLCLPGTLRADQNFSQQVFFQNSLSPDSYFYSGGKAVAGSTLTLIDKKLPIETTEFISGPNALDLQWQSAPIGNWVAEIDIYDWRNREVNFPGDSLYLWLYSKEGIAAADLPRIALRDLEHNYTGQLSIGSYTANLSPGKWTRVRIPLADFKTTSMMAFNSHRPATIFLSQGVADNIPHTLYIDDIRIENASAQAKHAPAAPRLLTAKGYERHVDITWTAPSDPTVAQYVIYRSMHGGPFKPIGVQRYGVNRYCDYIGDPHATASYKVSARTSSLRESPLSAPLTASTHPMTDDELLTMVQEASFRYYWEADEPHSGMTRESQPGNDDMIATGATGFGIMSMVVAAQRDFVPREQVVDRLLKITGFLAKADRFHGAWPHFISGKTGHAMAVFGPFDDGADLVETSFLMQGLLTARGYFNQNNPKETLLRDRITKLWEGIDWEWFCATPNRRGLYWHWSPDWGFHIANRLRGWNETMITYLEAIASPTHAVPPSLYYTGFTGEGTGHPYGVEHTYFGIPVYMNYVPGSPGPLFFTEYSYQGYDPRGWHDKYTDYFINNRNEALVSQAYGVANPLHMKGYGADCWGSPPLMAPRVIANTSPSAPTTEPSPPPEESAPTPIHPSSRFSSSNISIATSARKCGASMAFATPSTSSRTGTRVSPWD